MESKRFYENNMNFEVNSDITVYEFKSMILTRLQ